MPTTSYTDSTFAVNAIGGRTDSAGAAVADNTAEEARFLAQILTAGYLKPATSFRVQPQAVPSMSVRVGSGTAKADYYVVEGAVGGQGTYVVRLDVTSVSISVPAADASQPRTDQVYLVVRDDTYDAGGHGLPRLGYRRGDLGGADPGPDASWDAYALLASISVPAAETSIEAANVTDERVEAGLLAGLAPDPVSDHGALTGLGDDDHTQYLNNTRGDVRYNTRAEITSALSGKAASSHGHAAGDITSGTLVAARIPGTLNNVLASSLGTTGDAIYATGDTVYIGGIAGAQSMFKPSGQAGVAFSGTLNPQGGIVVPPGQSIGGAYTSDGSASFKMDSASFTMRFFWNGSNITFVRNDTNGIVKTFVIDHPTDPTRFLVHATTESPTNGVEYRGTATITGGLAIVELPDYFEALCAADDRQVLVSVVLPDEDSSIPAGEDAEVLSERAEVQVETDPETGAKRPGKAKKVKVKEIVRGRPAEPEHLTIPQVAASTPRDGRFRIACSGPDGTQVAWLVKATRKDVPPLNAEPLRADNDLHGDGPYTYLVPKGAA